MGYSSMLEYVKQGFFSKAVKLTVNWKTEKPKIFIFNIIEGDIKDLKVSSDGNYIGKKSK